MRSCIHGYGGCPAQFRNQYDNDITTWSPQGRLHQVEYAMEAVKQGSAVVGLKSNTNVVLLALKVRQYASRDGWITNGEHC